MTDLVRFDLLDDDGSIDRARETPVEIARDDTADAAEVTDANQEEDR